MTRFGVRMAECGHSGWMNFVIAWTTVNGQGTKIWFRVQNHMGGNAPMRCHCRCG